MPIQIKRPERTVELCTDLSLQAEHDRAVEAMEAAGREVGRDPRLTGETDPRLEHAQRVQEIEHRMAEHTLLFTLRALPRAEWTSATAKHPPRKDDAADASFRVNVTTFFDDVMGASIIDVTEKSTGERVEFDAEAEWDALADEMTNGQWEQFAAAVHALNRGTVAPDFSAAASRVMRTSASK